MKLYVIRHGQTKINNILVFKNLLSIVSIVAPVYGYLMYKIEKE